MAIRQALALGLSVGLVLTSTPLQLRAQAPSTGTIGGEVKEAEEPYTNYEIRARGVSDGLVAATTAIVATDPENPTYAFASLPLGSYVIELVHLRNPGDPTDDDVVCTEGPAAITPTTPSRSEVDIDCGWFPLAWWLIAAGAAGGVTTGLLAAGGTVSGAQ